MNRQQAKELLPIIQGYVDGKKIEKRPKGRYDVEWQETVLPAFNPHTCDYRIKPGPRYRSFKNAEECWQEMLKHQPFGWIKSKEDVYYSMVTGVDVVGEKKYFSISGNHIWSFDETMRKYTFADGTPFGIKEEH